MSMGSDESPAPTYAIRFLPKARQEAEEAALRLAELSGPAVAVEWLAGLETEVSRFSTNPRQFPLVPESERRKLARETRQLIYRRTPSSAAYRVLFFFNDAGEDGPLVTIIHIRHAARKPLTRKEANEVARREFPSALEE